MPAAAPGVSGFGGLSALGGRPVGGRGECCWPPGPVLARRPGQPNARDQRDPAYAATRPSLRGNATRCVRPTRPACGAATRPASRANAPAMRPMPDPPRQRNPACAANAPSLCRQRAAPVGPTRPPCAANARELRCTTPRPAGSTRPTCAAQRPARGGQRNPACAGNAQPVGPTRAICAAQRPAAGGANAMAIRPVRPTRRSREANATRPVRPTRGADAPSLWGNVRGQCAPPAGPTRHSRRRDHGREVCGNTREGSRRRSRRRFRRRRAPGRRNRRALSRKTASASGFPRWSCGRPGWPAHSPGPAPDRAPPRRTPCTRVLCWRYRP